MNYMSMTRRGFLGSAFMAAVGKSAAADILTSPVPMGVPTRQEPLNFSFQALEPYLRADVLRRHYVEHHAAYVKELQETLADQQMTVGNVVSLMPQTDQMVQPSRVGSLMSLGRLASLNQSSPPSNTLPSEVVEKIRRAGGGHINHTAFWRFLRPAGAGAATPQSRVARAIQNDFGSVSVFRRVFKEAVMAHPEAGWAWLVYRPDGCLVVSVTSNEDNPLMENVVPWEKAGRPILALDLWEHSYFEQYGHDREQYLDAWWKLVNWEFVSRAYAIVTGKA